MTNHYWDRVTAPHADRDRTAPPTDRDADNVPSDRVRAYAEAIAREWRPGMPSSSAVIARAVMAVADRERAEDRAIIEELRRAVRTQKATIARVEALHVLSGHPIRGWVNCSTCGAHKRTCPTIDALRGPDPTEADDCPCGAGFRHGPHDGWDAVPLGPEPTEDGESDV